MSRARRILLIAGASLAGLVIVVLAAAIIVVQTPWFQNLVREKIVSAVDDATGGRTEIGAFTFDLSRLRAEVRDFVIHGTETAPVAPLFQAKLLAVDLKLTSPFHGVVNIAYLLLDTPQANVIVYPDGRTNLPTPKTQKPPSNKSGLQTVVDLAIRRFDLHHGSLIFAQRKSDFNASGENLRAQLAYNVAHPSYTGEIDMSPLHLRSAPNAPLDVNVKLPLTLEADRITVAGASLSTPGSLIQVSASVDHLQSPRAVAHLSARIALEEVKRAAGLTMPLDTTRGPGQLTADLTGSADGHRIVVQNANVKLGRSQITASGRLQDLNQPGALRFNSSLALGEIGRLLHVSAQPDGTIQVGGNARLGPDGNYRIQATVAGRNLAAGRGSARVTGATLDSGITADPRRIGIQRLRLAALGGDVTASGALDNLETFRLSGKLNHFDLRQIAALFKPERVGYAGLVSGEVQAGGSLKNTTAVTAHAALAIQPGSGGVPVSGRVNVDYDGRGDMVNVGRSYIALPHTRLDLSGSLGQQIQIKLVTRNMADFQPVASIPVTFQNGGNATINATVSGQLSMPRIGAQVMVNQFSVQGRPFTRLEAGLVASPSGASVMNAVLTRGMLQAKINASLGLQDWKPADPQPLRVEATIRDTDVADILALAGRPDIAAQGALVADAHIDGTLGDPRGTASFAVNNGTLQGEHFDSLTTQAVMTSNSIEVPTLQWIAGPSRLDANATYHHAAGDLKHGALTAHIASNQVQLAQFQSVAQTRPGLGGLVSLNADAAGTIGQAGAGTDFQLTSVNADVSARGLQMQGMNLGDFTATANTSGSTVRYQVNSNFAGSTVRVNGQTLLTGDRQTNATAQITNLPIDRVLAVAGRRDVPVRGVFTANAQISGTVAAPHANATLHIVNGSAYQQPFNRLQATIDYSDQLIELPQFRLEDRGNDLEISGSFAHPANNLREGQIRFRVRSNELQLARFQALVESKPGLSGTLQVAADGAGTLRGKEAPRFSTLNAKMTTKGLAVNRQPVGDFSLNAETRGQELAFNLKSNFGRADIRGNGTLGLAGAYPVNARVTLSHVTYSGLANWIGLTVSPTFDGSLDGEVSVTGPASQTDALRGSLQLTKLEAHSISEPGTIGQKPRTPFDVHNEGPIAIELDRSMVTIRSFRLAGPYTDLTLSGYAPVNKQQSMNVRADGKVQLDLLQAFDPRIYSSGAVTLNTAVTGTLSKPSVNGRLQLHNASFNSLEFPNGVTDANGTVAFNGSEAVIQDITAQSGGGKITFSGFVGYGGPNVETRVQARIERVHVQASDSITAEASAQLSLVGTTTNSLLSGTVRISEVTLRSHSDIGSILNSASVPPSSPSGSSGFLAGMKFDVRILTTTGVLFRSSLTQNLQADANLTLRGNPDHPGMLGHVTITQGQVTFFGSKYNVDQGTISFFDPTQIEPVLNIDLSTTLQGVEVSLSVSGPAEKMTLSYRSDPPLEFKDIVSLLGSGTPPSSDPVLAARQAPPPQQNVAQAGASMLLGQAVASPVAGRLQRLFGVSKLKIDPQVTGASNTPQATLTLEQQINNSITFTYMQDVTQSNPQNIRVEWAVNPQWSAIAARDVTGELNVNLFYKRRFR